MPIHKPIKFREANAPQYAKDKLTRFISVHPHTYSAAKALLALAVLGGVISTAVAAPGIFHAVGKWRARRSAEKKERYQKLWRSFYQLKRERAIKIIGEEDGVLVCEFTKEGERKVKKFLIDALEFEKPKSWDREWRIIIFDVPEIKRKARVAFQRKLLELGCYPLQKSVWVYPFPCEEELNFIGEYFNVAANVFIFHTEEMPSGKALYHFKDMLKDYI